MYIHPNYDQVTYDNNIAIIEVKGSITFNGYIQAAALPRSPTNFDEENNRLHMVISKSTDGGMQLLRHDASLLSEDDCARISGNTNSSTNTLLCVDNLCLDSQCDDVSQFFYLQKQLN